MNSRTSFIYKYETSTLTPFEKQHNVLNLAVRNIFYIQLYVESAFTYNPGLTIEEGPVTNSKIFAGAKTVESPMIKNTINPEWNFIADFPIEVVKGQTLHIQLMDHDDPGKKVALDW